MATTQFIISIIIFLGSLILSAMPIQKAVKYFKKKNKFIKTLLVVFISGIIISGAAILLDTFIILASIVLLIFIYKVSFKLNYKKAFFVWLLSIIFTIISSIILEFIIELITKVNLF